MSFTPNYFSPPAGTENSSYVFSPPAENNHTQNSPYSSSYRSPQVHALTTTPAPGLAVPPISSPLHSSPTPSSQQLHSTQPFSAFFDQGPSSQTISPQLTGPSFNDYSGFAPVAEASNLPQNADFGFGWAQPTTSPLQSANTSSPNLQSTGLQQQFSGLNISDAFGPSVFDTTENGNVNPTTRSTSLLDMEDMIDLSDDWQSSNIRQNTQPVISPTPSSPTLSSPQPRLNKTTSNPFRNRQASLRPQIQTTLSLPLTSAPASQPFSQTQNMSQQYLPEYVPPRWQPDSEVAACPICHREFSFWFRKHHCRKCGRVVCAQCSPHRITIPRQFIARPPIAEAESPDSAFPGRGTDPFLELFAGTPRQEHAQTPQPAAATGDSAAAPPDSNFFTYFNLNLAATNPALGGGEEVRLCNPCVPDPNFEPPPPPPLADYRAPTSVPSTAADTAASEVFGPPPPANDASAWSSSTVPSTSTTVPAASTESVSGTDISTPATTATTSSQALGSGLATVPVVEEPLSEEQLRHPRTESDLQSAPPRDAVSPDNRRRAATEGRLHPSPLQTAVSSIFGRGNGHTRASQASQQPTEHSPTNQTFDGMLANFQLNDHQTRRHHRHHRLFSRENRNEEGSAGHSLPLPTAVATRVSRHRSNTHGTHEGHDTHERTSRRRRPRISEEDTCPICLRELPPKGPEGDTTAREEHVMHCIESTTQRLTGGTSSAQTQQAQSRTQSTSTSARGSQQSVAGITTASTAAPASASAATTGTTSAPAPASASASTSTSRPRSIAAGSTQDAMPPNAHPMQMVFFKATEKDCCETEDGMPQECTICMDEYSPGDELARLECFCKFHKKCIVGWFGRKPECPVHKIAFWEGS